MRLEKILATKVCKKCGELKPLVSSFSKCATGKDGYLATCKTCRHTNVSDVQAKFLSRTW